MKTIFSSFIALAASTCFATSGPGVSLDCPSKDANCKFPSVGHTAKLYGADSPALALSQCTATLIEKDDVKFVVLTAGHCFRPPTQPNYRGRGILFDPNVPAGENRSPSPNYLDLFLEGGVQIDPISYFDPVAAFIERSLYAQDPFDAGLVVFPRNAKNAYGETLDSRYGDLQPMKVINDAGISLEQYNGSKQLKDLVLTHVGYGTTFSMIGEKPYIDTSTRGKRNVGQTTVIRSDPTQLWAGPYAQTDTHYGPGDSGSPQFVEINGEKYIAALMGYNNLWGSSLSSSQFGIARLDRPIATALINCARNATGATFTDQVASIQTCVNNTVKE